MTLITIVYKTKEDKKLAKEVKAILKASSNLKVLELIKKGRCSEHGPAIRRKRLDVKDEKVFYSCAYVGARDEEVPLDELVEVLSNLLEDEDASWSSGDEWSEYWEKDWDPNWLNSRYR